MGAAGFFGQDAVARIGLQQHFDDGLLGGLVDLGDEVVGRLGVDLQQVEVQRGPVDDGPRSACRLDGDVEHGMKRLRHGATLGVRGLAGRKERAAGGAAADNRDFNRP
jgi:hypothetical protein